MSFPIDLHGRGIGDFKGGPGVAQAPPAKN